MLKTILPLLDRLLRIKVTLSKLSPLVPRWMTNYIS